MRYSSFITVRTAKLHHLNRTSGQNASRPINPILGLAEQAIEPKAVTCDGNGYVQYVLCANCFGEEVSAKKHQSVSYLIIYGRVQKSSK